MGTDVDVVLTHDGDHWVARNGAIAASGRTFQELDQALVRALQDSGLYPEGACVKVFMGFDFDTFPTWLRQYHTHYFNRRITLNL